MLDEYAELEKAAERLGIASDDTAKASGRRAGSSRRSAGKTRRAAAAKTPEVTPEAKTPAAPKAANSGARAKAEPKSSRRTAAKKIRQPGTARSGGRAEQVAALVGQRPGMSVKELGAEVGVNPTSLYSVIKRLERDGKLTKRGRELHPS